MTRIALAFAVVLAVAASAENVPPRPAVLAPEESVLAGGPSARSAGYYQDLVAAFAEGYDDGVRVRALVLPSFAPEIMMGLRSDRGKPAAWQVFALRPSVQIWGFESLRMLEDGLKEMQAKKKPADTIKRQQEDVAKLKAILPESPRQMTMVRCLRPLDAAIAEHVYAAWIGVLKQTRYVPPDSVFGTDGTAIHFSGRANLENYAGWAWMPDAATKPGMLANLAETLVAYCDGKVPPSELQAQAEAIEKKLMP